MRDPENEVEDFGVTPCHAHISFPDLCPFKHGYFRYIVLNFPAFVPVKSLKALKTLKLETKCYLPVPMQSFSVYLQHVHAAYVTQALYVILLFHHLSAEQKKDTLLVIFA